MEHTIYLVTGAAGFLGSHVCDELLERGEQVRALVLNGDKSAKYVPEAVEIVWGDLCDAASLKQFFTVPEGTETVVIHCASMVSTNAAYNQKLMDVNVGGTKNMINACLAHPECKKMVYVSSTGAIKELPKVWSLPPQPESPLQRTQSVKPPLWFASVPQSAGAVSA